MISTLKKMVSIDAKIKMHLFYHQFKKIEQFSLKIDNLEAKQIYIFLAADYGNLGDVAITYAQSEYLKQHFPDYIVTEIPISQTTEGLALVKKVIKKGDIVTTVGGGNMGDLYPLIEAFRQAVISNLKGNKIISFPQTIDFNTSKAGQNALNKCVKIYSSHPDLTLIAREHKTFDYFKKHFPKNKVILTPDIVLSLNRTEPTYNRKGVLICLRNDKEKKLDASQEKTLKDYFNTQFTSVKERDTHIGGKELSFTAKISALNSIWDDFRKAELIVTDRLHGMIFSYITGTPVLVFLNNNHKVKSSYFWIKSAPHVRLMEEFSMDKIEDAIKDLKSIDKAVTLKNMLPLYTEITKSVNL